MIELRLQRWLTWSVFAVLAIALAVAGYCLLFTTFMIYDDEGFVLLSLRNFSIHGGLYDQVYTQYGPFPYLLYDALHRILGFDFNNTSGRWITLVNWLGTAAVCATLVHRTTRSRLWAAYTLVGTFTYLWIMINEPVHPGGLITLVVATATWLGAEAWSAGRIHRFGAITGLACAALILTKINVGVFFCGAVVAWLALNSRPPGVARILGWLVALGCAALPIVLMNSLIASPWIHTFALVFAAGALGALLAGERAASAYVDSQQWVKALAWMGGGVALVSALMLARGTSLHGLLHGVVLDPLKQPSVYFFPVRWRPASREIALVSLVLAGSVAQWRWWDRPWFLAVVVAVRIVAALFFILAPLGLIPTTLAVLGLSYGVPLAWLFVLPVSNHPTSAATRLWVALVLVFQSLQAYPVAGSQLNWGTFLWLTLLALALHDAAPLLTAKLGTWQIWGIRLGRTAIAIPTLFMGQRMVRIGWNNFVTSQPLGLRGAESIRVPNDLTYALRIAVENLQLNADVLYSFPGLYSANLWTELPTPTLFNATHWFSLLSSARQQEIIDHLAGSPRAAILVQRDVLDYLARQGFETKGPLHDWLAQHFEKALAFGGYEIWVHRGRSIAAVSLARPDGVVPHVLQSLTLTLHHLNASVERIDLCNVDYPNAPLMTFTSANSSISIAPCGLDGTVLRPFAAARFPFATPDTSLVDLKFAGIRVNGSFSRLLLVLRDHAGARLGELLLAE